MEKQEEDKLLEKSEKDLVTINICIYHNGKYYTYAEIATILNSLEVIKQKMVK